MKNGEYEKAYSAASVAYTPFWDWCYGIRAEDNRKADGNAVAHTLIGTLDR